MTHPSGDQHEIAAAGYRAVVTQVGASLRLLEHEGRDLVVPWDVAEVRPVYRGAVLAPWPNRVRDGRYSFAGADHQLPVDEVERGCAIHGLVTWQPWWRTAGDGAAVELTTRLWPRDGYPFLLDLRVRYSVDADGLRCELAARNAGDGPAPWGCAPHPYVVAGPGRVDDWSVELPASRVLEVDGERLLPADPPVTRPVAGTGLDLRGPAPLAGVFVDHAYTGLTPTGPDAGQVAVRVRAAGGEGVEVAWDSAVLPWVQVHTGDRPEPELDRRGLAVEPMTCPPDALRSGVDLVTLAPGDSHAASWVIRALT